MCINLSRENLKSFLLREAKEEDVESAQDSILGKWAAIAKKAQTWVKDKSVSFLPTMIEDRLIKPLYTEGVANSE